MKSTITAEFRSSLEDVWNVVTNNENIEWRTDLDELIVLDHQTFIEKNHKGYEVVFKITSKVEMSYYEFQIASKVSYGTWQGYFYVEDDCTKVKFVENISTNKAFAKIFLLPYLRKHQRNYIRDMKKELGE
ncbi:MAG: hypothetical protein RR565_08520 [Erysipelothrix sp.]